MLQVGGQVPRQRVVGTDYAVSRHRDDKRYFFGAIHFWSLLICSPIQRAHQWFLFALVGLHASNNVVEHVDGIQYERPFV